MTEPHPTPQLRSLVESAQQAIADAARRPTFDLPYAMPDRRPNPAVENLDRLRTALFALSGVLLLATSLGYVASMDGRMSAGLLDTGLVHTVIWPVSGSALILSAGFAALPHQLSSRRQRAATVYALAAAASMSCALTLVSAFLPWTAAMVATLATVLALAGIRELNRHTARNHVERVATDMPLSFFGGFALVYTLQLWFAAAGWNTPQHAAQVAIVAALVALAACVVAHSERGRHAFASGFGLAMVAAAVQGALRESTPLWVCITWAFLAVVVFICAENRRFQLNHAEHRARRGKPVDW